MQQEQSAPRAHWKSRTGFVLAAAGSAVGLGNIWKFPYITGENGGGAFVLVYLLCILLVGVPVMIAEILLGRTAQGSPATAFRKLSRPGSPWIGVGILGVATSFALLSYYASVAGWALHFTYLSFANRIAGQPESAVQGLFEQLTDSSWQGVAWQVVFLALVVAVVSAGVSSGIERWSRIMMPGLFGLLLVLVGNAMTMPGWGQGIDFLFGLHTEDLTAGGVLEALGHAFFSLSLGMGAMITYGSYLSGRDDVVTASAVTSATDTLVAVLSSLMLFPVVFTFGLEPGAGPGLLFVTLPTALAQMTGGTVLSMMFFVMLVFGALTSGIAMFEVIVAYLSDEFGIPRLRGCLLSGLAVTALGIPATVNAEWFGMVDYLVSNWALPLGGLGTALFVAWRMDAALKRGAFEAGSSLARFYKLWLWGLKFPVPVCIVLVFLHAVGLI